MTKSRYQRGDKVEFAWVSDKINEGVIVEVRMGWFSVDYLIRHCVKTYKYYEGDQEQANWISEKKILGIVNKPVDNS